MYNALVGFVRKLGISEHGYEQDMVDLLR